MITRQRVLDLPPRTWPKVVDFLRANVEAEDAGEVDVVVSVNTGSIFLASLLADWLRRPLAYVRPRPKGHGKQNKTEGRIRPGDRALVVVDTALAAESVADGINTISSVGGRPVCCLAVRADDVAAVRAICRSQLIPAVVVGSVPVFPIPSVRDPGQPGADSDVSSDSPAVPPDVDASPVVERKRRVARALLDVGAVSINRRQPFTYASGLISPIYTDCRLLLASPENLTLVIDAFVDFIATHIGRSNVDALVGTATAGIPHAALIANRLGLPLGYVTFETEGRTTDERVSGSIGAGDRVVVIEDLLTTGASVLTAAEVFRKQGASVGWCAAIFTYGSPVVQRNFAQHQIEYATLCDLATLLSVAQEQGLIEAEDEAAVHDWLAAPETWAERERARPGPGSG